MAEIIGLDSLLRKLDQLGGNSKQALKTGILKAAQKVQGDAKEICSKDTGQLRNSIYAGVEDLGDKITGKVYTNNDHAVYVEFGTGPVGDASPKDLPPGVDIQYRHDGWWIHESQIDAESAEKYYFKKIETPQGVFYFSDGQPAKPYMYPALRRNKETIKETIASELQKEIHKLEK